MLDKSEAVIKNGQSRDNIGHKALTQKNHTHRTKLILPVRQVTWDRDEPSMRKS